jgi:acetolactate synthase regulatory subunit
LLEDFVEHLIEVAFKDQELDLQRVLLVRRERGLRIDVLAGQLRIAPHNRWSA